jgi:hypothetical protein
VSPPAQPRPGQATATPPPATATGTGTGTVATPVIAAPSIAPATAITVPMRGTTVTPASGTMLVGIITSTGGQAIIIR